MAQDKGKQVALNPADIPLVGVETAPEIFVDGYQGASVNNGVAKIHFFTIVFDPVTEKMKRRVVFTMIASAPVAVSIAETMTKLVDQMKADGIVVPQAPERENSDA